MFAVKRSLKLNHNEATLMAKHAGFRVEFANPNVWRGQAFGLEGN
ncbi:hypothetical protein QUA56_14150 [Microcoleus sp. N3A4]